MEFKREDAAYVYRNDQGDKLAEITFTYPVDKDFVIADHTYVSDQLRGQGVAEQLLDHLVKEMTKEGKKIKAECSYVLSKFENNPDKYGSVNADNT